MAPVTPARLERKFPIAVGVEALAEPFFGTWLGLEEDRDFGTGISMVIFPPRPLGVWLRESPCFGFEGFAEFWASDSAPCVSLLIYLLLAYRPLSWE